MQDSHDISTLLEIIFSTASYTTQIPNKLIFDVVEDIDNCFIATDNHLTALINNPFRPT